MSNAVDAGKQMSIFKRKKKINWKCKKCKVEQESSLFVIDADGKKTNHCWECLAWWIRDNIPEVEFRGVKSNVIDKERR